jgi:Tfp pilus assembly protein PilN
MTEQLTEEHIETAVPAPGPIRIPWATVPRVNLLPIEIIEKRRFRRTQMALGAAVVGCLLAAGAGTFWAEGSITDANNQLLIAQANVATRQAEQSRYAAAPKAIAQVDAAKTARTLALGTDVLWYRYLNDLEGAQPAGLELNAITVAMATVATSGTSSDPLSSAGIGTITFSGTADQYSEVANWLDAVGKITGFSSPSLTTATRGDNIVTFSSGATVDSDALSGRYKKNGG